MLIAKYQLMGLAETNLGTLPKMQSRKETATVFRFRMGRTKFMQRVPPLLSPHSLAFRSPSHLAM